MRILFFAQCYAPEDVSGAVLTSELAVDLNNRGHQVTFVTGAPNYPYGRVYPGYRNRIYQEEYIDGVRVIRTWSYISPRKSFWPRILHYGTFSATALFGGLLAGKPDILFCYSPPLPLGLSIWLLSRLWHVPWVLQLEDLYPDAAVAAGVLRNHYAIRFFEWLERFLYRHATHISLISEGFRRNLSDKGVSAEKISLIPVWADPDLVQPMPKENNFRKRYNLTNKFVVMYAGNIGLTSCLEDVLEAGMILKGDSDIRFVIIGEGVKKEDLQDTCRRELLNNIIFLPYQPREDFSEVLAAADLNLVTLNQNSSLTSLPSKIFNIMASARPILVIAPLESEIAHLVEAGNCGIVIPPGQTESLAKAILTSRKMENRLNEMGQNGRNLLMKKYSRVRCVDMHENMLFGLCKNAPKQIGTSKLTKPES
jgi:colanic acid biosynthesis glycosyl transferase WcaI